VKNAGWIVVVCLFGWFGIDYYNDKKTKRERLEYVKLQKDKLQSEAKLIALKLAKRHDVDIDWEPVIFPNPMVIRNIHTAEFEKAWINKQGVIFYGVIDDYFSKNQNEYYIKFNVIPRRVYVGAPKIELVLSIDKKSLDEFMRSYPNQEMTFGFSNVAAVVEVTGVQSKKLSANNYVGEDYIQGVGLIKEMVYTGIYYKEGLVLK